MNRHRHLITLTTALVALLSLGLGSGCAEQREPIDRVQPNAIDKSALDGEWYYLRTVVAVPAAADFRDPGFDIADLKLRSLEDFDLRLIDPLLVRGKS